MDTLRQTRLLLWKDYLIRKRKLVSLAGATWATIVMLSLVIVRDNIDVQDLPTCQYAARALPSAGMFAFLQSFVCEVNNECRPLDKYEEIPLYEKSRIRHLERKLRPLIYNESILEIASVVPDALKLVATFSRVIDQPDLHHIGRDGLHVSDLFLDSSRVGRWLSGQLNVSDASMRDIMAAEVSFQGIFNASMDLCDPKSLAAIFVFNQTATAEELSRQLCLKSDKQLEQLLVNLLPEVDYRKYFKMFGDVISQLSEHPDWPSSLGEWGGLATAMFRLWRPENFLPVELAALFHIDNTPLVNITVISTLMDLLKPVFGGTDSYRSLRALSDTLVEGARFLYKTLARPKENPYSTGSGVNDAVILVLDGLRRENIGSVDALDKLEDQIEKGFGALNEFSSSIEVSAESVIAVLSKSTSAIVNLLPRKTEHEVLYYSTILTKLIEGAHKTADRNTNMEEIMYNVTRRHPDGVRVLTALPVSIVGKTFDALADSERTQIFTSKISSPGQMFCDAGKLANFFRVSVTEGDFLKKQMCNNAWRNYVTDIVNSFGIFEVKTKINNMASLVISETIGKDNNPNLYSIDRAFSEIQSLVADLTSERTAVSVDWPKVLNVSGDAEIFKVVKAKVPMAKEILITIHGALAREVVKQNPILEAKITPILISSTALLTGINKELSDFPKSLTDDLKTYYKDSVVMMLRTLMDKERTFRVMSAIPGEVLCDNLGRASRFLAISGDTESLAIMNTLCRLAERFGKIIDGPSQLSDTVHTIKFGHVNPLQEVNWATLGTQLKKLYKNLEDEFPYLFALSTFGMDNETTVKVANLTRQVKEYWFSPKRMDYALHLGIKCGFTLLDMLNGRIFNMSAEVPSWNRLLGSFQVAGSFMNVSDTMIKLVTATILEEDNFTIPFLPSTVEASRRIVPNVPFLIKDLADAFVGDDTNIANLVELVNSEPFWPCSNRSLTEVLAMSEGGLRALRGLEALLCTGDELQKEWTEYPHAQRVRNSGNIMNSYNGTHFKRHEFLEISSSFDELAVDLGVLREAIKNSTEHSEGESLNIAAALKYAEKVIGDNNKNATLIGKIFRKLDQVLDSVNTSVADNRSTTFALWERFKICSNATAIDNKCRDIRRAAWKNTLKYVSVAAYGVVGDLFDYFSQVNEPNATILQMMGFVRGTGLYKVYEQWPDFLGVLLNSYWDYGFMNQVRKASKAEFWDCESIVDAMVIPSGSRIEQSDIQTVKPYVCPSVFYWLSLPRGENTFLNLVAKTQYYFNTMEAQNLNSSYVKVLNKSFQFSKLLDVISKINVSDTMRENMTINNELEGPLNEFLSWNVTENDPSYQNFGKVSKNQFISTIYLLKVATIVNNISESIISINTSELSSNESANIVTYRKLFKRRPTAILELYFDTITDVLWKNDENYEISDALDFMCANNKNNDTTKDIMSSNKVVKTQYCSFDYRKIHENINLNTENSRNILENFVTSLQNVTNLENIEMLKFFSNRPELISLIKLSMQYSEDLGLQIYIKYLQSNLKHYNVVHTFLNGDNWWSGLKELYSGPFAKEFFNSLESIFEIAEDILKNLDKIKLVALLKDVRVNSTEAFCVDKLTLSDYVPDSTGALSRLKRELCSEDKVSLFSELPPLLFSSQGYEQSLKLSKDLDYASIDADISAVIEKLRILEDGPKSPLRPFWITDDKLRSFKEVTRNLFSKESVTKVVFGAIYNIVDGATLFLNNSDPYIISTLTSWLRQVNLQLFKKDEYDSLLCHLSEMSLTELYENLNDNFHWEMAIAELLSERNYTILEFNKALNQFLEHVLSHILHAISSSTWRLQECQIEKLEENVLGNVSFHLSIVTKTLRMIRSALPHLSGIEGVKKNRNIVKISRVIAPRLSVFRPLGKSLRGNEVKDYLKKFGNGLTVENIKVDVNKVLSQSKFSTNDWILLNDGNLDKVCTEIDCTGLTDVILKNFDAGMLEGKLADLQMSEFWRLQWLSDILLRLELFLSHAGNILGVGSRLELAEMLKGNIGALLDALLTVLQKENMKNILFSLNGMIEELHPLLKGLDLDYQLQSVSNGLCGLAQFRESIVENNDLSVEVWKVVASPERLEMEMRAIGINHTNFWSVAAPRIHLGRIDFKPLFTTAEKTVRLRDYVCQSPAMSQVLLPEDLEAVTAEDVFRAVAEQFCALGDDQVEQLVPAVLRSLNATYIFGQILDIVLLEVYESSNLTQEQGKRVISKFHDMITLLPDIQDNLSGIGDDLTKEPLLAALKKTDSVKGLLSSSEFLSSAGDMLCGKPLITDNNRFYKAIAETRDYSSEPDPRQLEALPSDFCRTMYKDILSMGGGKIVWSFIKPLIMGRILYTPDTPAVGEIMHKANESFARMSRMRDLIKDFANSFDSVEILAEHRESLVTLKRAMNAARFRALVASFGVEQNSAIGDVNLEKAFEAFGDIKSTGSLVKRMSDILGCVNLDRFKPTKDEFTLSNEAVKLASINEFSAGIVFNSTPELPGNIEYKIRMDIDSVPTTTRKRNQFWTPGPEANFVENMRYFRGFVQIQDLVDKAIIELAGDASHSITKRDANQGAPEWAVYTQQMPYPCYKRDVFQASLYESQALIVAFYFSLILTVSSAVRFTIHERESGNTMLMSVMGLRVGNHTLSWFVSSLLETAAACALMLLALKTGRVLPNSDPWLLLLVMINFAFSVVTFCYMVSKLFKSASLGSVGVCILYFVMFMPFVIVLSMEAVLSTAEKVITCISMCTAFSYSILYVARYEAIGVGVHWHNVWTSPDDTDSLSVASTTVIVFVDAIIYTLIGLLIEWYSEYRNRSNNLVNSATSSDKAGISIVNVSKIYGEGTRGERLALDNVSIELSQGQVTTLLGQNGAGKTTLIKIITGALKPSSGSIVIRGEEQDRRARVKLGVCPQRDVLIENMTALEHLQFYAALKSGERHEQLQAEVQNMLQALNLGRLAHEQVRHLSGGLRRRVCVGLAFVCSSRLVLLDEPSSGVDPVARRDTWSLIVKLKEGRTVLMTTHHLDEAELLSDQIVIMHKGRVHTTGTPIEIKRSLGSGYRLTASYPDSKHREEDRSTSMLEASKELLRVVRTVVKNAQLSDVRGNEVDIALPFFDANGLNNDYLSLCKQLESKQSDLNISFSMNCCSLEQVFLGICQQADGNKPMSSSVQPDCEVDCEASSSSSSHDYQTTSTNSAREDDADLVPDSGRLAGSHAEQYAALLRKRLAHYSRNYWLLTSLFAVPALFMLVAMGFSLIRPPADNETSLRLSPDLYGGATQFFVPYPSNWSEGVGSEFAEGVMDSINPTKPRSLWTPKDNPECKCENSLQRCNYSEYNKTLPQVMTLPDARTALDWATTTQQIYMEKRYGGWSSSLANDKTNLVAWYNNKGHHAMPAFVSALSAAALRRVTGDPAAGITTYTHPLKISDEQLSKSTLLQHVADIGISAVILIGFSLVPAAGAVYLVQERCGQQKRLQLLCGVRPITYWLAAITWDMLVIVINIGLTVIVLEIFSLPVFVEKDNLAAICLLLLLFGWACSSCVHVFEKCFSEPSYANMLIFCVNVALGVTGLAVLLILDIISDSDRTDNARWVLHKIFMLSPQFALGDGLVEIAKNSIQALVLRRFGMDTYSSPLTGGLISHHYTALVLVGLLMFSVNIAIEYDLVARLIDRLNRKPSDAIDESEMEDMDVATERYRVELAALRSKNVSRPVKLHTIGNINAGFVNTEGKSFKLGSLKLSADAGDALQCLSLRKEYHGATGKRVALHSLTLGISPGECVALLGENGAGKSTTFKLLTGELRPTSGQILLHESPVGASALRQGLISYCPQNDAIDELMTVREQLRFYCCLRGIASRDEVIRRTLQLLDLKRYADQHTRKLSGGNRRKLCTAIAIMGRSALVLLDEPTSGMDPGARGAVARAVSAARRAGRAVLVSTHALEDASALAQRLALLRRGRLATVGPVKRCRDRFGGGYVVCVRLCRGADVASVWAAVTRSFPGCVKQGSHYTSLQFLLRGPGRDPQTDGGEGCDMTLSHIFSELAALQSKYDIEDYTVNQSSLYQMFDNFAERKIEDNNLGIIPNKNMLSAPPIARTSDELMSVTSL